MAEVISAGEFATDGERRAADFLRQLPTHWVVICNKTIPSSPGRSLEVDFIILANKCIFVLDEKSWHGTIGGNDQHWKRDDGSVHQSPLNKIHTVASVLSGYLDLRVPVLKKGKGHFVFGGVLLSIGNRLPRIQDPRIYEQVFLLDTVIDRLVAIDRKGINAQVGIARDQIRDVLVDLTGRMTVPRTISLYKIEETTQYRPGVRLLRATTQQGEPRTLMLYDMNSNPTNIEATQQFYQREYQVLHTLQKSGIVPRVHDPFPWSDGFLIVPIEPPKGISLSTRPHPETRQELINELEIANICFASLSHIHNQQILHRALDPNVIYVVQQGAKIQVQFTNFFAARVEETSIAVSLNELSMEDPYAAPPLAASYGYATIHTDVWSLALIFLVRFARTTIEAARTSMKQQGTFPRIKPVWASLPTETITALDTLLQSVLTVFVQKDNSPVDTMPSAKHIAQQLGELSIKLKTEQTTPDNAIILDDRYRVHRELGTGAMARTFLATDKQTDVLVAIKQFFNPADVLNNIKTEYQALNGIKSKHLPTIRHVEGPDKEAHIIMEYVPGVTLADVTAEFPWHIDRWWIFAQQLLTAIDELEQRALLHRDIKPPNIILHEKGGYAVLIDFGFAVDVGKSQQLAGTPLYIPPEALNTTTPPHSTDRYAAAIVLFHALTGKLPIDMNSMGERIFVQPDTSDERVIRLANVLYIALDPDPNKRYTSVEQMRQMLQQAMQPTEPIADDTVDKFSDVVNTWVDHVRGLYRNSGSGNADNRGFDSEFVRLTYVQTALDTNLQPLLFTKKPKAVFLSGNPGDGKTAFLAHVQAALTERGATLVQDDASGWEMHLNGHIYRSCYDASESHAGKTADEQLTARLHGLDGDGVPNMPITVMVAINDGRLADYFTRHRAMFGWLAERIDTARHTTSLDQLAVWVIDLKRRAFVQLPDMPHNSNQSVVVRVLERLVDAQQWAACGTCLAASICPIRQNAAALRLPHVQQRLEYLLLIIHLRQQRHTTMRDLRSVLAYLITSNISCDDVHTTRQQNSGNSSDILLTYAYWHNVFSPIDDGDELIADITTVDPARYAHPHLDRYLHFHQSIDDSDERKRFFFDDNDLARTQYSSEKQWLHDFKRRLYFEGATTLPEPLAALRWQSLVPYQHAQTFLAALQQPPDTFGDVLQRVAQGLLQSDGIIGQRTDGFITVTVKQSEKERLSILKQLPLATFRLGALQPHNTAGIETIPELLVLEHTSGTPRIELTLDLFELLLRLADGALAETPEYRPLLEDLAPFKHALLLQTTHDLVLIENRYRIHYITQHNGAVVRLSQQPKLPESEVA